MEGTGERKGPDDAAESQVVQGSAQPPLESAILIEIFDHHGRIVERQRIVLDQQDSVTFGRSAQSDVVLNDPHCAPLHLSIGFREGCDTIKVCDLGSRNGFRIGRTRYDCGTVTQTDVREILIGRSRIVLRASWDVLPEELSDHWLASSQMTGPATLAVALVAGAGLHHMYRTWLSAPVDLVGALGRGLWYWGGGVLLYIAFWALLTRIMRGTWRWLTHITAVAGILLAYGLSGDIVSLGWFAFDLPNWPTAYSTLWMLTVAVGVFLSTRIASNATRTQAALIAIVGVTIFFGSSSWLSSRQLMRNVNAIDDATVRIYPPAFRLLPAESLDTFLADLEQLGPEARRKRDVLPRSDIAATKTD